MSCCTDLRSCGICACHQKHTQHNTTKDSKVRSVTCSRPSFDQHRPSEARGIGTGFEQDSGIALSKALRQDSQSRFSLSHTRSHPILLLCLFSTVSSAHRDQLVADETISHVLTLKLRLNATKILALMFDSIFQRVGFNQSVNNLCGATIHLLFQRPI